MSLLRALHEDVLAFARAENETIAAAHPPLEDVPLRQESTTDYFQS